jgi:AraC-like DNA-binding protein
MSSPIAWPDRPPRILHRPGVGAAAGVLQRQVLAFRRLFIEQPVLIVVERGEKAVRWAGGDCIVRAGEAVAIAGGQALDIENRPDGGIYRAFWLAWDASLLVRHAAQQKAHRTICAVSPIHRLPPGFVESAKTMMAALDNAELPPPVAASRAGEMLHWLDACGCSFVLSEAATVTQRVRQLVGSDLARAWLAPDVASQLAMSEATLRRKLADEGDSLSAILSDARLSFALTLLQATSEPVAGIALAVGYQSPSHLTMRFRRRFGFPPSAIRAANRRA